MAFTVSVEHLAAIAGRTTPIMEGLVEWLNRLCPLYEIDLPQEYCHFLAQACHETDRFKTLREYASGSAYEGRQDLGNIQPGDGVRFKGRGIFQTTGRANYLQLGIKKGRRDLFINTPELLEQPEYAVWSACEYWKTRGLNDIANHQDGDLLKRIKGLRRKFAQEIGFLPPQVHIRDNLELKPNGYRITLKGVEVGGGDVSPGMYLAINPGRVLGALPGPQTRDPAFGLPATWVDATTRENAQAMGYTVVDAATVLSTHLTELLKSNMSDLLSYGEVQKLLKDLPKEQGELVKDIVPSQVTISGIQRVLQLLLAERISIRDLSTILEGIAEALAFTRNPAGLVEHVRARLSRQLCAQHSTSSGYLPLIALSARWEQAFAESIIGQGDDRSLAMQPSRLSEFITLIRERFEDAAREGEAPVLVTSASIRPFVRGIVERFRSQTPVLSQAEIHPRARLKTVGSV